MPSAALKIVATIAQPFVIAGSPFSITTTIENGHEGQVDILRLTYHIPHQVQWIHNDEYATKWLAHSKLPWYKKIFAGEALTAALRAPGQQMWFGEIEQKPLGLKINSGEANSLSFHAIVPQWLLSSGGDLAFPGIVSYRYKEETHTAEFEVRFTLRPPLRANATGAVVGTIVGAFARGLKDRSADFFTSLDVGFVASTTLSATLAIVAVIYSSRRTGDAQPIITVEDFWGGMLVGFTVGYMGIDVFSRYVPIAGK
jgi:hypothetical protein